MKKGNRINGPLIKNRREKPALNYGQIVKGLVNIINPGADKETLIEDVEMPKPKRPYKPRLKGRKPHVMREKKIERAIIRYLRGRGFKCGKVNPEVGGWDNGIADILCFGSTNQYYIEVKSENGRQQKNQIEFQEICERTGGIYILARGVDDVKCVK